MTGVPDQPSVPQDLNPSQIPEGPETSQKPVQADSIAGRSQPAGIARPTGTSQTESRWPQGGTNREGPASSRRSSREAARGLQTQDHRTRRRVAQALGVVVVIGVTAAFVQVQRDLSQFQKDWRQQTRLRPSATQESNGQVKDRAGAREDFLDSLSELLEQWRRTPPAGTNLLSNPQGDLTRRRLKQVIRDCTSALKRNPELIPAYRLRATAREHLGDTAGSLADLSQIVNRLQARGQDVDDEVYFDRAQLRRRNGDLQGAATDLSVILEGTTHLAEASLTTQREGSVPAADPPEQTLSGQSRSLLARAAFSRGIIYAWQDRLSDATEDFHLAASWAQDNAQLLGRCAWLWASVEKEELRDGQAAVAAAERACQLTDWGNPRLLGALAAAYAEQGQFDEAVAIQEQALKLASQRDLPSMTASSVPRNTPRAFVQANNSSLRELLRLRLLGYLIREPVREPLPTPPSQPIKKPPANSIK